ncbi:hypothetical protein DBR39_16070 [Chryseobacterium sp. KBW03]|uniref:hypothetical protein n=1 Tax=Chryseobacterium sp. KBW03 TaxID=2153362 RepID=UPI000F5AA75C|nr:hypothetical protein [Chryseobacterium sp. KBW03]RQO36605.1 hypothetical protein DBR39_16070 [Chryseobacterium sp. KBW03]
MKITLEEIKDKYVSLGIAEKNVDYALNAVKSGTKKDFIMKNLTSDIRKVEPAIAHNMLDEMFAANGGEFKYENRGGYLYSTFYLIAIVALGIVTFYFSRENRSMQFKLGSALLVFIVLFFRTFIPTIKGRFRE